MTHARLATLLVVCSSVCCGQLPRFTPSVHAQRLKSLSLAQLGDIEVTTQSKEPTEVWNTPAAIYVLTSEDIRRSGVTNVPDALRLIPGVEVARVNGSRNWAVGLRGFADQYSKYVLVLVDGRSIYTPLFGGVLWTVDNVMLEDIDRIEVIAGPGGTIWGANAVNGIINIVTKSSRDTQGALVSSGGGNADQNTEDLRYGSKHGTWAYRANAFGFVRSPEYHVAKQPDYDWSRFGQVGFRTDRKVGANELTLEGDGYWGKFGDAQTISTYIPPQTFISYKSMNVAGGDILGRWRKRMGDRADLYLQGFWWHDHRIGSNFGEDRDTFDLDFLHRFWLAERHQISYGFGLRLSPSKITQVVPTIQFVPLQKTDSIYSAFLQDEVRVVPERLSLLIGSKIEWNNYTGYEAQPSGRLLFTPSPTSTIWASVSRALRTPDRVDEEALVDIFAAAPPPIFGRITGNHHLRAERLIAYELGGRTLIGPRLYLSVSGFHNAYHDLIARSAPSVGLGTTPPFPPGSLLVNFHFLNGIRGNTDGGEFAPEWQATSWWKLRAGYSYLHIHLQDQPGFTDTVTQKALHGSSPNSQAFAQSQIDVSKRVDFDQAIRFVGALPAQNVKAYVTGDARLGWNPTKSLSLSIAGQNLFQPHHAEFGIDPAPGVLIKRSVYGKIVWTR